MRARSRRWPDWVRDLDPPGWVRLGFTDRLPVPSTLWRLLTRTDDTELAAVLTRWVRARTTPAPVSGRRWRQVIAIDGKVLRGAKLPGGRQVHLLSAFDTSTGMVLGHVQISVKSNEIPAFTPLLDLVAAQVGSLSGIVFVADAMHSQTEHARAVAARGACLMVAVKANQPTLFAQLKGLPWADVSVGDRRRDIGHGRRETRTVKALTVATRRSGVPARSTGRADYPNPHRERHNHQGDGVSGRLAPRGRGPTG